MENYPAPKRKEILTCATAWMNMKDSMLSEISQTQGRILYGFTYVRYVKCQIHKDKVELWFPGLGLGEWRITV